MPSQGRVGGGDVGPLGLGDASRTTGSGIIVKVAVVAIERGKGLGAGVGS